MIFDVSEHPPLFSASEKRQLAACDWSNVCYGFRGGYGTYLNIACDVILSQSQW